MSLFLSRTKIWHIFPLWRSPSLRLHQFLFEPVHNARWGRAALQIRQLNLAGGLANGAVRSAGVSRSVIVKDCLVNTL
jgi:hypothetical protein